jgi:hypothetical protein
VAERFISIGSNEDTANALEILRENFLDLDSVGAGRAAEFLLGEGETDEDLRADIMGFMSRFIEKCG